MRSNDLVRPFRPARSATCSGPTTPWFAPTDQTLGPDGAIYIADWHDRRTAHPDPDADWDRTNGRIFAVTARGAGLKSTRGQDMTARTNNELVALLKHPNVWYRRKARRLLTERHAADVTAKLYETVMACRGDDALEALWALHGCVGLDEASTQAFLNHSDADVRAWSVRLVGDEPPYFLSSVGPIGRLGDAGD